MDPICPICLLPITVRADYSFNVQNQAILDCCKHTFCKKCIMAWMKTTFSCPLCKRGVGVIIADIQSPSEYSQYLPNGKYLYSSYSPRRKVMFLLEC